MKRFVSLVLVLLLSLAISVPALAADNNQTKEKEDGVVVTRVEETKWYYRSYNGEAQKRLWSITNGVWKTDWMPYDTPYPA